MARKITFARDFDHDETRYREGATLHVEDHVAAAAEAAGAVSTTTPSKPSQPRKGGRFAPKA